MTMIRNNPINILASSVVGLISPYPTVDNEITVKYNAVANVISVSQSVKPILNYSELVSCKLCITPVDIKITANSVQIIINLYLLISD